MREGERGEGEKEGQGGEERREREGGRGRERDMVLDFCSGLLSLLNASFASIVV